MNDKELQQLWEMYQHAWAPVSDGERAELLRKSVAEEVVFTSPAGEGEGLPSLQRHVAEFQQQFPGASFRTDSIVQHHGQMLAAWVMLSDAGAELLQGNSYARWNEQGLLMQLSGFWKQ